MYFIFFGPPGSGKGTQAKLLSDKLKITHLSTGDILRAKIKDSDKLSLKLNSILSSGNLVSDEIVNETVSESILSDKCKKGFILDGYPRTTSQSNFLISLLKEHNIKLNLIIDFKLEISLMEKRILERSKIEKRSDDNIEIIKNRFKKYILQTQPLANIYKEKFSNIFSELDASEDIKNIHNQIEKLVKNAQI